MRSQDVGVLRIQDGRLHGPVEQGLGMVDQIGVQGVVASDQDGQGWRSGTSGATGLLPQGRAGPRPARHQNCVQAAYVDAQLQGVGSRQTA